MIFVAWEDLYDRSIEEVDVNVFVDDAYVYDKGWLIFVKMRHS